MTEKEKKDQSNQPKADQTQKKTLKREMTGIVVSTKMKDTIVVAVTRYVKHPKYRKYQKRVKRYHAHDVGNKCALGEKITIRESKPLSKKKHFVVLEK